MSAWEGGTALHIAAWRGNADLVELLLADRADPTLCNLLGQTPLQLADEVFRGGVPEVLANALAGRRRGSSYGLLEVADQDSAPCMTAGSGNDGLSGEEAAVCSMGITATHGNNNADDADLRSDRLRKLLHLPKESRYSHLSLAI